MKDAVIFDLGNTLVSYYSGAEWPGILERCIGEAAAYLEDAGRMRVDAETLAQRVQAEGGERADHRVKPLEGRLARILGLSENELGGELGLEVCRRFMGPIFALARPYDDALPTLAELRRRGIRTGILSNTPWGSPAELWKEELDRHGLMAAVDVVVFCRDVGWRKPAREPFAYILSRLDLTAGQCLFVGDDPRWDIAGPGAIGMEAVLIDRAGRRRLEGVTHIRSLRELLDRLS